MSFFEQDHDNYRDVVREYAEHCVTPHYEQWEADHAIGRSVWQSAAEYGLISLAVPEAFGGMGLQDWRYRMVVAEELAAAAATSLAVSFTAHDDLALPCLIELGSQDQKERWLPRMATGEAVGATAISDPAAGSDVLGMRTSAVRDGDDWILNGQKTFVSNGVQADLVIVAAKTDPGAAAKGITLFVVETGTQGFERGRTLDKVGLHGQDTAELFFTDCRVTASNVLGEVGSGFASLMSHLPRARLSLAVGGYAGARAALAWTQDYVYERKAFGQRVGDFQNTRFELAEIETEIDVTRAYLEQCVRRLNEGTLTAVEAAKAKWWATELDVKATSRLLQLFGGYGFMEEYPIARAYRDCRAQTLYGGTTEVMKEIIGRDIASRYR